MFPLDERRRFDGQYLQRPSMIARYRAREDFTMFKSRLVLAAATAALLAGCGGSGMLPATQQPASQSIRPLTWPSVPKTESVPGTRRPDTWPTVPKTL